MEKNMPKRFEFPEEKEKTEKYLININTVCKKCGFLNKGSYELDEKMPIACCGKCGEFIITPEGMSEEDKESVKVCIMEAIKETQ